MFALTTSVIAAVLLTAPPETHDPADLKPGAVVTLPPQLGVLVRPNEPVAVTLALPWSGMFVTKGSRGLLPSRVVLEPGLVFAQELVIYLRAGFRWMWELSDRLSCGTGYGITFDLISKSAPHASVSPELVVQYGRQGRPGFLMGSVRLEYYGADEVAGRFAIGASFW